MNDEPDFIVFQAPVTVSDLVAVYEFLRVRKRRMTQSWRKRVILVLAWVTIFAGCLTLGLNRSPSEVVHFLAKPDNALRLGSSLAVVFFVVSSLFVYRRLTRNSRLRRIFARLIRHRPDVTPSDPSLTFIRRYRFDDTGFTAATQSDEQWESWRRISALEETTERLILRIGSAAGHAFPKHVLPAALQERLRQYVSIRCAGPDSSLAAKF